MPHTTVPGMGPTPLATPVAAPRPPHRGLQMVVRILIALAMFAALASAVSAAVLLPLDLTDRARATVSAFLILTPVLLGAAVAAGHNVDRFVLKRRGGGPAREAHLWTRLKAGGLLLHLLSFATGILLLLALLARMGLFDAPVGGTAIQRSILLLVAILGFTHAYTLLAALRVGMARERSGIRFLVMSTGLGALVVLAGIATYLAFNQAQGLAGTVRLDVTDIPFLVLGAQAAAAMALVASRHLPGIAGLLEEGRLGESVLTSTRRSVFLPIFAAFSLLFLVFLLFILFGVGFTGFVQQVVASPALMGVMLLLMLAFMGSIIAAFSLARSEPVETPLFRRPADAKRRKERWILGVSLGIAALLFAPAVFLFQGYTVFGLEPAAWIHLLCLGILMAIGPYGFYQGREHRRIRLLEERFPDFLRDIASSHKGGITLSQAAVIASRGEYGPLGREVQKMADQLKWNVSFNEALQRFSDRVQTPLVQRAVSLILQANKSGGATTEVLLAAARDAREIKTLENERMLSMSLYTVVIYVTFFVFLGVAAIMYSQFIPHLVASSQAAAAQAGTLGGAEIAGIGSSSELRLEDFQLFYFLAALVQGLGDGIVAGMMGQGKAVLGLRHSFFMVLLAYVTFTVLLA